MAKKIIFCADGTWSGPGAEDLAAGKGPTNVFKLFCNLAGHDDAADQDKANERERRLDSANGATQVAKYLHGVGDSDNPLVRLLGGAVGAGLITRIVRGFTFVSRNHTPGDRILLLGYSRGAYTVRALAGMIAANGLLDAGRMDLSDKQAAYRAGAAVWYRYRASALAGKEDLLGRLEGLVSELPDFVADENTVPLRADVPIAAVAVWDTVGAYGIPEYAKDDTRIDACQFADTVLSSRVARGYHAVSIDEARADFTPTLWSPAPRIAQRLFAGAHDDVGGGHAIKDGESGLSDAALAWMQAMLNREAEVFAPDARFVPAPDPAACAHQPWRNLPWSLLPSRLRTGLQGLEVDGSVAARMAAGPVRPDPAAAPEPYAPANMLWYRLSV